jgi:hypothetical protein
MGLPALYFATLVGWAEASGNGEFSVLRVIPGFGHATNASIATRCYRTSADGKWKSNGMGQGLSRRKYLRRNLRTASRSRHGTAGVAQTDGSLSTCPIVALSSTSTDSVIIRAASGGPLIDVQFKAIGAAMVRQGLGRLF